MAKGLFVGMVTLDWIYLCDHLPQPNEKIAAADWTLAAGGPATNAAVTFSYLGNAAALLGTVGQHPSGELIRADLAHYGVALRDLDPERSAPPPVSSILVDRASGERTVISLKAPAVQPEGASALEGYLDNVAITLLDGHQMAASEALAKQASARSIPVAIDGGSWKPGFERVLPYVTYAICSADFYPPGCQTQADTFAYLADCGIPHAAITQGEGPIPYLSPDGEGQIPVPTVESLDTAAAGDILHGAFCHHALERDFPSALTAAAQVASRACQSFGSRQWMEEPSRS
ncbi:MAG: ribokinase [Cyanobacteria bacterium QS_8_64_29]|nr:MAG: ribokinase [Cyanobacteria bacterium QS_8_64_29]